MDSGKLLIGGLLAVIAYELWSVSSVAAQDAPSVPPVMPAPDVPVIGCSGSFRDENWNVVSLLQQVPVAAPYSKPMVLPGYSSCGCGEQ